MNWQTGFARYWRIPRDEDVNASISDEPVQQLTPAPSSVLRAKLAALRRKHLGVALLTGVAMVVVVAIEMLALAMFVDWWLDLPWGVRLVLLVAQFVVLGYMAVRMILAPWCISPTRMTWR